MSVPLAKFLDFPDRPSWIPAPIGSDWDTDPYAYQTEEELMPAGGLHGQILAYLMELLRAPLESKGLMLMVDSFLLYRDAQGTLARVAPDLMLMPHRFPPPSAYHLEREPQPPLCAVEVTSPKSHVQDQRTKAKFYHILNIPGYVVVDAITARGQLREQIGLQGWHSSRGRWCRIIPDASGWLNMPNTGLCLRAQGQQLQCQDQATGQRLLDNGQSGQALQEETQRADQAAQRAKDAEAEVLRLQALLAKKT